MIENCENYDYSNFYSNDSVRSFTQKCHKFSTVMPCANFWPDLSFPLQRKAKHFFCIHHRLTLARFFFSETKDALKSNISCNHEARCASFTASELSFVTGKGECEALGALETKWTAIALTYLLPADFQTCFPRSEIIIHLKL